MESERRVFVQGVSALYREVGEGPVVLFVHGNASNGRDWQGVMRALAPTHRVVVPSLPGFGETDPVEDVAPPRMVSFIAAFLDAIGVDEVVMVGHSYGGLLAAEFALAHPRRVTRLALVDANGLGRMINPLVAAQALIPSPIADLVITALLLPGGVLLRVASSTLQFRQPWRVPWQVWRDQLRLSFSRTYLRTSFDVVRRGVSLRGQRFVVLDRLRDISVPTLVVWGLTDDVVPVWQALFAAWRLPEGKLAVIGGAGHIPHLDTPEEFLDHLGPFVRDNTGRTAPAAAAPQGRPRDADQS
ncbi:alpha/beta hydrolase [Actinokineospora sp. PR83]|uniref:alpha/beta fold hydrolase n=1 Tax=Actinokineospora sp. PR83 TaxID=2884908 RepID=UPI001F282D78|nr:alpha/beta hydrolase [Actinokineospora sp. PR83]MCG8914520.1 alpha/beta hydrolase [Actinokineospora sp. PR83]